MPSELQQAKDEMEPRLAVLIQKHGIHKALEEHEVRIDWLLAFPEYDENTGEKKAPAIVHQGYPARGVCRIVNYRDRVKGNGDVEITIDGEWWEDELTTEDERLALLDHELSHIRLKMGKTGRPDTDDAGRPKIEMRKHDFQVGWFHDVAARWGASSAETQQAQLLQRDDLYQTYFAFDGAAFAKPSRKISKPRFGT